MRISPKWEASVFILLQHQITSCSLCLQEHRRKKEKYSMTMRHNRTDTFLSSVDFLFFSIVLDN